MPIYRPHELFALLNEGNLSAKKSLSQNFLIDGNIVRKIVDLAHIQKGDFVLEIGPGPGVLTEELLLRGARVLAIEKDRGFAKQLERFQEKGDLTIIEGDILETDLENVLKNAKAKTPVKVLSNLPYHITTPIIAKLLTAKILFSMILVMVQEEVARRFVGRPKTKDYSSISLFLAFFADVRYEFKVKKSCFLPMPKVDSAVVLLTLKTPPLSDEDEQKKFLIFVRTAFNQRRKMLRSALDKLYPKVSVQEALEKSSLSINARAEELTLEEFLRLYRFLTADHEQ